MTDTEQEELKTKVALLERRVESLENDLSSVWEKLNRMEDDMPEWQR